MSDAIAVGPFIVPVLRVGALLALILGAWVASVMARRWGLDSARVSTTAEWAISAFVLGARAGFVAANGRAFADAPWTALYLWQPGYAPLAGVVTAALVVGVRVALAGDAPRKLHAAALGAGAVVALAAFATVLGVSQLDVGSASDAARVGEPAPSVVLWDLEGREVSLRSLRGGPVVLNFWATWCPPCRREMPALDALHDAYRSQGVAVVGVAVGESSSVVQRFLADAPVAYPIWVDAPRGEAVSTTQQLLQQFRGVGLPTTVFIDREGVVRKIRVGELSRAVFENEVETLLR